VSITTVFNFPVAVTVCCWLLLKAGIMDFDQAVAVSVLSFVLAAVSIALAT
jgi:hypothetical protein